MLTTMIIKQSKLAISVIFTVIASTSVVYADGFYTIIGPDGRPMIIPKKPTENENRTDKVIRSNDVDSPAASEKNLPVRNNVKLNLPTISMSKQDAVKNAVLTARDVGLQLLVSMGSYPESPATPYLQ